MLLTLTPSPHHENACGAGSRSLNITKPLQELRKAELCRDVVTFLFQILLHKGIAMRKDLHLPSIMFLTAADEGNYGTYINKYYSNYK